ncbi:cytochrome c oxidase subunit 3 [Pseudoroseomonas cervicalis]|uniref:cytochrome c oxidase subunit 3 n=1 Tax=Teichococcus cervicalis TaxID=204525 RepID=UPI0027850A1A|nr:cytochrome c oxidase subunit 3 [Pseudoroseomonas cervicalis]MDQ1077610.1 cytochrome c oxidase subunit 3 [Pseudoroseomonas cervicalis]
MTPRPVLDLSRLPMHCRGSGSPSWWGTLAFMLIEGTGFALMAAILLYLASLSPAWPPQGAPLPRPGPGALMTLLLLLSLVPNLLLSRWAARHDLRRVRLGLVVMALLGTLALVPRIHEFAALGVSWDDSAYGSALWMMLGLHTTHVLTDLVETFVLAALMFTRHAENPRRFDDVRDGALYWNFVVLTWPPIFLLIYGLPRL